MASEGTLAQAVRGDGGVSPDGASVGVPKSMTRATRFLPCWAGDLAHMDAKSVSPRGFDACWESSLTAKRKPWTSPSDGRAVDGPCVAYVHRPPVRSQKDQ